MPRPSVRQQNHTVQLRQMGANIVLSSRAEAPARECKDFVRNFFDLTGYGHADREGTLYWFALILQIHMSVSIGLWGWREHQGFVQLFYPIACLAALHLVASRKYLKVGLTVTALLVVAEHLESPAAIIPHLIANHNLLEYCCIAVLLFIDDRNGTECQLGLAALRWIVVIVIFSSGMQKVWHGTYFHADFLSWSISRGRWQNSLGLLLDPAELDRLRSYAGASFRFVKDQLISTPPGPYRVQSTMLKLISNAVWLLEVSLPLALLLRRTRQAALVALVATFGTIIFVVHEAFFGMLVLNLLLLFAHRRVHHVALPLFVAGYAVIAAAQLGALPVTFPR